MSQHAPACPAFRYPGIAECSCGFKAPAAALVERARLNRFDCATCGTGIAVDEDGCCRTCGQDATAVSSATPIPAVADRATAPAPLEQIARQVLRYIEEWEDAEERYHTARPDGKAWADRPNSVGAKFVHGQIASAQDSLRALRDELEAALRSLPSPRDPGEPK